MNRSSRLALIAVALLGPILTSCSESDPIIGVQGDDPEMVAAIAKARETLPHFWQVYGQPQRGEQDFAIKVRIEDENGIEHFWANEIERQNGAITAVISNDPDTVKSVKLGDRIQVPEADITDWTYTREGKMVGNFTLRALFKEMSAEEVESYKKIMVDP